MNLGEKLRQLRHDQNLTQPELADAMGIEQSYVSKLENDKYVPSSDVFGRILDVFKLEVGDLVDDLDQGVRNQLRQIPDVERHFNEQKQLVIGNRRRWLLISTVLVAVGAALIYGGSTYVFASKFDYQYVSYGVVLEGESREIFRRFRPVQDPFRVQRSEDPNGVSSRLDEQYSHTRAYMGTAYNVPVDGGSRTFYLEAENEIDPWQNKAFAFIGVLFFVLGAIGLILDKKLSRYQ